MVFGVVVVFVAIVGRFLIRGIGCLFVAGGKFVIGVGE